MISFITDLVYDCTLYDHVVVLAYYSEHTVTAHYLFIIDEDHRNKKRKKTRKNISVYNVAFSTVSLQS